MWLSTFTQTIVRRIHDFYKKLVTHSQVLDTMGKPKETNGYVRLTLEKLLIIDKLDKHLISF